MFINNLLERINRRSPIIFQSPWIGAIGNCSEEMYYGLLRARREKKRVFFLFPYDLFWKFKFSKGGKGINRALLRVGSPLRCPSLSHRIPLHSIAGWVLSFLYFAFRGAAMLRRIIFGAATHEDFLTPNIGQESLWRPISEGAFSRRRASSYGWKAQMQELLPVRLPEEDCRRGEELKLRMGIPADDWHVCLHVREGSFYGHNERLFKSVRNASISNYLLAMKFITERGGWIVRMGDSEMVPLPKMERVIDYPHTPFKCGLMDIYLIQECRLYIGSQSGIWSVASLFQKPMLTPNMAEWLDSFPERGGDLGIVKHVYSRFKGRFLSLREALEEFTKFQYRLDWEHEYELHENTEQEVYELVKEYFEETNAPHCRLQQEFNQKRTEFGYSLLENERLSSDPAKDLTIKYHLAARLEGCSGALSRKFLEDNWEWDRLNDLPAGEKSRLFPASQHGTV